MCSDTPLTLPVYTMLSGLAYMPGQYSVLWLASAASTRTEGWSSDTVQVVDIAREGPFDAYASPMDTEDSPLVTMGFPGCPYWITSYNGLAIADMNPAFGLQLHHPQFLEFIGAPESVRLLYHSPTFWVDRLGDENAMAAAVNLQRDAGIMLSNLQILSQFVTSLHRMSSEMMSTGMGRVVFPAEEIADLSTAPRAPRAAKYMAVAPTDWSGRSRASAGLVLQCFHELSVLLSGGSATSGVMFLLLLHILLEHYGSDYDVMTCDRCSYYGTFPTCWATALVM